LTLTSAAQGRPINGHYRGREEWAPHGSLSATLVDADGGSGTLQVTF
jgi:hypothetical protein